MQDGGHLTGWLISGLGVSVVNSAITDYMEDMRILLPEGETMRFAVGDGNHSLASAKACWEKLKPTLSAEEQLEHPARYALVELENIHDSAIAFEPIHRVLHGVDVQELCYALKQHDAGTGYPITLVHQGVEETFFLSRDESPLALSVLQPVLDEYLQNHPGRIDYIHGDSVVRALAAEPNTLGLILPGMEKEALFPGVLQNGVLPRKTFSMGHAREKRYYLEAKMRI